MIAPTPAMDRLKKELRKKAGIVEAEPPPPKPTSQEPPSSETESPEPESNASAAEPSAQPSVPAATPAPAKPTGKVSPWKLVDEYKGKAAKLEAELLEVKKQIVPEQDRKSLDERMTSIQKRNEELENEIRFTNYQKSKEFNDKYQMPYEAAWGRAIKELGEILVTDPSTGQQRVAAPQDLQLLVNMPLGQAREVANSMFGDFSDDVMAHRKEIRGLFEAQHAALEDARKNGAERDKNRMADMERQMGALRADIKKSWDTINTEVLNDPSYGPLFKPRDGQDGWNTALQKGYELVDQGFMRRPDDPGLSPEERQTIIKIHAAIRNKAAGWNALRWENQQLVSQLEALKKKLAGYAESAPAAGENEPPPAGQSNGGRAMDRVIADLRKLAK